MLKLTKPKLIFQLSVKRKRLIDRVKKMSPYDERKHVIIRSIAYGVN